MAGPRLRRRQDQLIRHAVPLGVERAQTFVALDQIAERLFERRAVERAVEPHRHRNEIGAARALQPMQEPEPPLRV